MCYDLEDHPPDSRLPPGYPQNLHFSTFEFHYSSCRLKQSTSVRPRLYRDHQDVRLRRWGWQLSQLFPQGGSRQESNLLSHVVLFCGKVPCWKDKREHASMDCSASHMRFHLLSHQRMHQHQEVMLWEAWLHEAHFPTSPPDNYSTEQCLERLIEIKKIKYFSVNCMNYLSEHCFDVSKVSLPTRDVA